MPSQLRPGNISSPGTDRHLACAARPPGGTRASATGGECTAHLRRGDGGEIEESHLGWEKYPKR